MDTISKFLEMGGYAGYVWPSYLAVFGLLGVLLWLSLRGLKAAETDLAQLEGPDGKAVRRQASPAADGAPDT